MRLRACLRLIALLGFGFASSASAAELLGSVSVRSDAANFGGFSGLELSDDGAGFTAISDRGLLVSGQIERDADGRLVRARAVALAELVDGNGQDMPNWRSDSEGLAIDGRGRLYVSFEGDTGRVWRYDTIGGPATELDGHADFQRLQGNSGLEGLAVDGRGTVYALPERSGQLTRPFPVWRFRQGRWDQPFSVPRKPPHLPVGLDIGPDGRLYLLERHFRGISFSTRIRRFDIGAAGLTNETLMLETTSGTHLNLEGIAIWEDRAGRMRATMISDNNFNVFLGTDLVEYRF